MGGGGGLGRRKLQVTSGLVRVAEGVVGGDDGVLTSVGGAVDMDEGDVTVLGVLAEAAHQVAVEVLAERLADEVQGDGVDAGVDVAEAEADDAEGVPEVVVVIVGVRVEVEPQHEYVVG